MELQAYVVADNRTAELATWDRELLSQNLALIELLDDSFDLSLTGFNLEEIDLLKDCGSAREFAVEDELSCVPENAVSRLGDLWEIDGRHLVLCGDATDGFLYQLLLGTERADLVITDPP